MKWQKIETAPKDQRVLVYCKNTNGNLAMCNSKMMQVAEFDHTSECWLVKDLWEEIYVEPLWWQPLPYFSEDQST